MKEAHPVPRFFNLAVASRLYLQTARGEEAHRNDDYVPIYQEGPLEAGVDGSMVWAPTISNTKGILIVQKVLAGAMTKSGLKGLEHVSPIILRADWPARIHSERLSLAPEYVWFRLRRSIEVDPLHFKWPAIEKFPSSLMPFRIVPVAGSHGGPDVFGVRGQEWHTLFCTRRFVEAARTNKWKGFSFCPMDTPYPHFTANYVDYLGKQWPPERWYPEGITGHPNNLEFE